ncbi:MAG: BREX system Lon protease-like protein BrxL, partial [Halocynthiibacter sp.]
MTRLIRLFPAGFFGRNETLVAAVIIAFGVIATLSDPLFFSVTTLSDLLRAAIVLGIFAIGAMLVLVSGGIDVSFTAVAVAAMYMATVFALGVWPDMPWYLIFVLSMVLGACLGAINGVLIAWFGLPTLIVTLGTLSVFRGFLLTFVGSERISALPPEMRDDTAFMDRIHAYLPGWDFPKLNPNDHFTNHFGLVSDFLSECWSRLRTGTRIPVLQGRVNFGGALSGRDLTAVNK